MQTRFLSVLVVMMMQGCIGTASQISCMLDPPAEPEPKLEYAEFELRLRYVDGGEEREIKDTVICEYAGRVCDGRGLHNDWSHRLASGNHRVVLRHLEGGQYLYKPTGGCGELMEGISRVSDAVFLHARETTWSVDEVMDEDALARDYGIRIVDFSIRHER